GTVHSSRRVVRRPRPARPTTATARGSRTRRSVAKPAPKPEGTKTSVWLSACCQWPRVRGDSFGRAEPSTTAIGLENVSRIGAAGLSGAPGAGLLTSTGERAGGNQLTATGGPSRSHERAAAATSTEPAAARRPNAIERPPFTGRNARWPLAPTAAALTGRSNRTRITAPTGTVSQRSLTCATGARRVSRSLRLLPSAHASQPGRRTVASTDTRSPGVNCTRG